MPKSTEVVCTGRNAPQWLLDRADLITEMNYTKVLLINQRVGFIEKIDATIRNKLKETLSDKTNLSDDEIDYVFTFAVAGRIAVYRKWILSGFKQSEETISGILEKISSNGFDAFLHWEGDCADMTEKV